MTIAQFEQAYQVCTALNDYSAHLNAINAHLSDKIENENVSVYISDGNWNIVLPDRRELFEFMRGVLKKKVEELTSELDKI